MTNLPQAGLLMLNNVLPGKWDDATAEYQQERRRLGQELWTNIMTVFSLDPEKPVSAEFISFTGLPDAFDEASTTLIPVCRICGRALVIKDGKLTCPGHGVQARWSYAGKGRDE